MTSFTRRSILITSTDFDDYWVDRAPRMGLTSLGLHPLPHHMKDAAASSESLMDRLDKPDFRRRVDALAEAGVGLEIEMHAMELLMPRALFPDHPDWFRADEQGDRVAELNCCPSNGDALTYIEERAAALARRLGTVVSSHRYFLWIDDASRYCACERCEGLAPSDQALLICNAIARGLRTVDPLATESFLAYQDTIFAPTQVRPERGVVLEYAPIDRDSTFRMRDVSCRRNVEQASHIDDLLEWFGRDESQVLEYWLDDSRFNRWRHPYGELPLYSGVLRDDLDFYASRGFEGVTTFACGLNRRYARRYGELPLDVYADDLAAYR